MRQININMELAFIQIGKTLKEKEPKLYLYYAWLYYRRVLKRARNYFKDIMEAFGENRCQSKIELEFILDNIHYLMAEKTFSLPKHFNKIFTEKELMNYPILCELMVAMLIFYYTKNYVDV